MNSWFTVALHPGEIFLFLCVCILLIFFSNVYGFFSYDFRYFSGKRLFSGIYIYIFYFVLRLQRIDYFDGFLRTCKIFQVLDLILSCYFNSIHGHYWFCNIVILNGKDNISDISFGSSFKEYSNWCIPWGTWTYLNEHITGLFLALSCTSCSCVHTKLVAGAKLNLKTVVTRPSPLVVKISKILFLLNWLLVLSLIFEIFRNLGMYNQSAAHLGNFMWGKCGKGRGRGPSIC